MWWGVSLLNWFKFSCTHHEDSLSRNSKKYVNIFKCRMCSASFAFKTSFDQHCHFVHDRSTQMICKFCHGCYSNLKWHKLHYWKYYTCDIWRSQFPSQESLFQKLKTQNILFSCRIYKNWTSKCIIEITYNLHVHGKSPNPKSIQCTDKKIAYKVW